jgi:hypothetical protein
MITPTPKRGVGGRDLFPFLAFLLVALLPVASGAVEKWAPTPVGVPAAKTSHTAVWTGTKMIVWGGFNSAAAGLTRADAILPDFSSCLSL